MIDLEERQQSKGSCRMVSYLMSYDEKPIISIIIPTCGRVDTLRGCLDRLDQQLKAGGFTCEVLVCDDSAFDDVRNLLSDCFPHAQWHRVPGRGASASRNFGAGKANGTWIIFLDDDVLPEEGFLNAYSEAFRSASEADVAFEGATHWDRPPPSLLWEAPHNANCDGHPSCNWGFRKTAFLKIGAFDERYLRSQDIEFAARAEAMGYRFNPLKEAVVTHPLRRIPSSRKLAARWEYRVLYSLELGMKPTEARFRVAWHVFRVIQSRFRNQRICRDNFFAVAKFGMEWLYVLWLTPGWVKKWRPYRKDSFWKRKVEAGYRIPKWGL
jgi:GT2 family glycosyltransferase